MKLMLKMLSVAMLRSSNSNEVSGFVEVYMKFLAGDKSCTWTKDRLNVEKYGGMRMLMTVFLENVNFGKKEKGEPQIKKSS